MLTPEELMKPRYKVIADWPGNTKFKIGDIIKGCYPGEGGGELIRDMDGRLVWMSPEKYTSIFRRLEWWEERDEKDMPGYVKYDAEVSGVVKVTKWHCDKDDVWFDADGNPNGYSAVYEQPATETEYLNHKNKSNA